MSFFPSSLFYPHPFPPAPPSTFFSLSLSSLLSFSSLLFSSISPFLFFIPFSPMAVPVFRSSFSPLLFRQRVFNSTSSYPQFSHKSLSTLILSNPCILLTLELNFYLGSFIHIERKYSSCSSELKARFFSFG